MNYERYPKIELKDLDISLCYILAQVDLVLARIIVFVLFAKDELVKYVTHPDRTEYIHPDLLLPVKGCNYL